MFKKRGEPSSFLQDKKLLMAITTLVGTIVGAGMLGIPYVLAKAGFVYGSIMILAIGIAFIFLNLFVGEVVLRTKGHHQLTGYAEKYLGLTGKRFMMFSMLINIYGALIAYLIGEGTTLHAIFGFGTPLMYTLIFFAICSFIIYRGIKATGMTELILISLLLLIVVIIGIFSYNQMNLSNLSVFHPAAFFIPYGVVLFALMGSPAIPEIKEVLGKEKYKMKKAILIGSSVPIVLYLVFAFIVISIVGLDNFSLLEANQRIATVALSIYSNQILGLLANLIAVLAMFTSFLTLGLALVDMYRYDYDLSRHTALALTLFFPLIVVLVGLTSFIAVLSLTGALAGGIDGILVILMYWKAKKLGTRKPEYSLKPHYILGTIMILMFGLGILSQFLLS